MSQGERFIRLEPVAGKSLPDLLFELGVEFPCGGTAACGGCKIRVLDGVIPVTPDMLAVLSPSEIDAGWRLGCMAQADAPVTLVIAQWEPAILSDETELHFEPAEGLAAVVDLGTTTLVVQLVDRATGIVLGVESALNPQTRLGSDLMSRVQYDLHNPGELTRIIRTQIGFMLAKLASGSTLQEVLLVGNTVMHHLFGGLSVEPLSAVPFRSPTLGPLDFDPLELGWSVPLDRPARFLPCIGGFVGSDILAGIIDVGMASSLHTAALLDLGTNGEIVVGNRLGIVCASTAAGPAFEGGQIDQGMRAGPGAIDRVLIDSQRRLACSVIGGIPPRGLCGSGLVDAIAALLELNVIDARGRLPQGARSWLLVGSVHVTQSDIRQLQLAKAAIAAGLELLQNDRDIAPEHVSLAGAFGNYIRGESARRIGLLPPWVTHPKPAGNAALRGARLLLLNPSNRDALIQNVLDHTTHVELAANPRFQDRFVEHMLFPVE
jgi:uncharacterized 2Fe-2S/4Fe-4S cluster protein (DUF4445 family)